MSGPTSDSTRDKLRSLLVIIAILAIGGWSTSLVFHNALGVRASITVLVVVIVAAVVARANRKI